MVMSNILLNYLKGGSGTVLRDFQHASRLYVDNNYVRAPKVGFLYFVAFNINSEAIIDSGWAFKNSKEVGVLAKKVDLPKFNITTETLNQYNRKTVVQTKLNYSPISIDFHDDNANITNNLWINYYKFYYKDSNYGGASTGEPEKNQKSIEFQDTKFGETDHKYGRYQYKNLNIPFFTSIDIYVLHQQQFTQITLVNPKITEWSHDSVNQAEGGKVLQNKMTLAYENVFYNQGIVTENAPEGFSIIYYDKTPSPLGNAKSSKNQRKNPILDIASILAKNYLNKKGFGRAGVVGYNIGTGILGQLGGTTQVPPPSAPNQPGIFNLPGGVGINIFKGFNTGVDGKIRANPAAIILPKIGGGGG